VSATPVIPSLQWLPELLPEWERAALLTIDVQRDALDDGTLPVAGTTAVIPNLEALVTHWRETGRPIVHVMRIYKPDGSNVDLCRRTLVGERCVLAPGTPGVEVVDSLLPRPLDYDWDRLLSAEPVPLGEREWIMYKPRWSAFQRTGLGDLLANEGVTTVVVAGCNFPNCPRSTVYDATARDFRTVFVADATSGVYEQGIRELSNIGVNVVDAQTCVAS
jgi:nicotinamidase-related amidase